MAHGEWACANASSPAPPNIASRQVWAVAASMSQPVSASTPLTTRPADEAAARRTGAAVAAAHGLDGQTGAHNRLANPILGGFGGIDRQVDAAGHQIEADVDHARVGLDGAAHERHLVGAVHRRHTEAHIDERDGAGGWGHQRCGRADTAQPLIMSRHRRDDHRVRTASTIRRADRP